MDHNQHIIDRPRSVRFFCNGDPFYLGRRINISRKHYPTFDRLLNDLSRKLNEAVNLPYGVRQIFVLEGGKRVNSIQKILEGDQIEFVCAGFETFRPLQYGQRNIERWSVGKTSVISLNTKSIVPQKSTANRILSDSNVNRVIRSKNSRIKTNNLSPTKSTIFSVNSDQSRKQSVESSRTLAIDKTCERIREGTEETVQRSCDRPNNSNPRNVNLKKEPKFSKRVTHSCKDLRPRPPNGRERVPNSAKRKEISSSCSLDEGTLLQETVQQKQGSFYQHNSFSKQAQKNDFSDGTECLTQPMPVTPATQSSDRLKAQQNELSEAVSTVDLSFLLERFEMGDVIGQGNFAVVKRCRWRSTGEECAAKIIAKRKRKKKDKMIDNELNILRQCQHPNIVRLFDVYETDKDVYVIMELVKGGDLFDAIRINQRFSEREASSMIKDMASALVYLHQRTIVHRDVKPENILVQLNSDHSIERLKLTDFGLAIASTRKLYKLCGTPIYVAPEMLADVGYRSEVDMWSLGVILYILLSGYPPFRSRGSDDSELFALIQLGHFVFDSPQWDDTSKEAKELVQGLMDITAEKRLKASDVLTHPWILLW